MNIFGRKGKKGNLNVENSSNLEQKEENKSQNVTDEDKLVPSGALICRILLTINNTLVIEAQKNEEIRTKLDKIITELEKLNKEVTN